MKGIIVMGIQSIISSKAIYLLGLIVAFLTPISAAMLAVGFLIIMDLIFGLIAAKKRKEKINSRRLSDTAIKALVYQLLIISGYVAMTFLIGPWFPLVKIILGFLAGVEILSIGESFSAITGLPFIKYLKLSIKNYFKNNDVRGGNIK